MAVYKFTSVRRVLSEVADMLQTTEFNEQDIMEDCARAMEKLRVNDMLSFNVAIVPVADYIIPLPKGLVVLENIAYKADFSEADETTLRTEIETLTKASDGFVTGILDLFTSDSQWEPIKPATGSYTGLYHYATSLNVPTRYQYRMTPFGYLTTDVKEGCAAIAYWKYPTDDNGDFIIPDDQDFIEAMKAYCLKQHWERKANMQVQGAMQMLDMYNGKWAVLYPKAKSKMLMPNLGQLENMRNIMTRLVPRSQRYMSFFGNLATPENNVLYGTDFGISTTIH